MKHCCEEMAGYIKDEDEIMYFSDKYNEYLIPIHDGGSSGIVIRYCPWCGQRLPKSTRGKSPSKAKKCGKESLLKGGPRGGPRVRSQQSPEENRKQRNVVEKWH